MPLPAGLARFNRKFTNRVTTPFARRLPWFGVVRHVGRRTGTVYETPVNCWVGEGAVTIALTYGSDVDWLRNLVAAGGGEVIEGGKSIPVGTPVLIETGAGRRRIPAVIRGALALIEADEFVELPIVAG